MKMQSSPGCLSGPNGAPRTQATGTIGSALDSHLPRSSASLPRRTLGAMQTAKFSYLFLPAEPPHFFSGFPPHAGTHPSASLPSLAFADIVLSLALCCKHTKAVALPWGCCDNRGWRRGEARTGSCEPPHHRQHEHSLLPQVCPSCPSCGMGETQPVPQVWQEETEGTDTLVLTGMCQSRGQRPLPGALASGFLLFTACW